MLVRKNSSALSHVFRIRSSITTRTQKPKRGKKLQHGSIIKIDKENPSHARKKNPFYEKKFTQRILVFLHYRYLCRRQRRTIPFFLVETDTQIRSLLFIRGRNAEKTRQRQIIRSPLLHIVYEVVAKWAIERGQKKGREKLVNWRMYAIPSAKRCRQMFL